MYCAPSVLSLWTRLLFQGRRASLRSALALATPVRAVGASDVAGNDHRKGDESGFT